MIKIDKDTQDFLSRLADKVQTLTQELHSNHQAGRYVFRGETAATMDSNNEPRPVTSQLYRWVQRSYTRSGHLVFDQQTPEMLSSEERKQLPVFQKKLKERINNMLPEPYPGDDNAQLQLLARMQHFGCKTNLIDFTRDYLVALFFACNLETHAGDSSERKADGRIIFLKDLPRNRNVIEPQIEDARAVAQKSVFRLEPQGIIPEDEYETMKVPWNLKPPLLIYLAACHGISTKTIFPDFQGAMQYTSSFLSLSNLWDSIKSTR